MGRIESVDIFRGLTVALMIVVNTIDHHSYPLFLHAPWHGCTLADVVFPFFIITLGLSSALAYASITPNFHTFETLNKRVLKLFLLGLFLNAFPLFDFQHLRYLGVLQRIALCFGFASLLVLYTAVKTQIKIFIMLIIGYWILLTQVNGPIHQVFTLDPDNNWALWVDTQLISPGHRYKTGLDPEGILSTLGAFATSLMGVFLGSILASSKPNTTKGYQITQLGCFFIFIGGIWSLYYPMNKTLWTGSFTLWTGGWAYLLFAVIYYLIDIKKIHTLNASAFFGRHALTVFVMHVCFLKAEHLLSKKIPLLTLPRQKITGFFELFLPQEMAFLAFALWSIVFWYGVLRIIFHQK